MGPFCERLPVRQLPVRPRSVALAWANAITWTHFLSQGSTWEQLRSRCLACANIRLVSFLESWLNFLDFLPCSIEELCLLCTMPMYLFWLAGILVEKEHYYVPFLYVCTTACSVLRYSEHLIPHKWYTYNLCDFVGCTTASMDEMAGWNGLGVPARRKAVGDCRLTLKLKARFNRCSSQKPEINLMKYKKLTHQ